MLNIKRDLFYLTFSIFRGNKLEQNVQGREIQFLQTDLYFSFLTGSSTHYLFLSSWSSLPPFLLLFWSLLSTIPFCFLSIFPLPLLSSHFLYSAILDFSLFLPLLTVHVPVTGNCCGNSQDQGSSTLVARQPHYGYSDVTKLCLEEISTHLIFIIFIFLQTVHGFMNILIHALLPCSELDFRLNNFVC